MRKQECLKSYRLSINRFSHGEEVAYADLKKYTEPDFSLLSRYRCPALVKRNDNIWHKARVISTNCEEKTCTVLLEHKKDELCCPYVDVYPIADGECKATIFHQKYPIRISFLSSSSSIRCDHQRIIIGSFI